jgi:hypothetical protein
MKDNFEIGSLLTVNVKFTPLMSDEHIIKRYLERDEVLVLLEHGVGYHRVMTGGNEVGLVIRTRLRRV